MNRCSACYFWPEAVKSSCVISQTLSFLTGWGLADEAAAGSQLAEFLSPQDKDGSLVVNLHLAAIPEHAN